MIRAHQCTVCARPLRSGVRADCRYCGVRCRVRAHRIRYTVKDSQRRGDRRSAQRGGNAERARIDELERQVAVQTEELRQAKENLVKEEEARRRELEKLKEQNQEARNGIDSLHTILSTEREEVKALYRKIDRARVAGMEYKPRLMEATELLDQYQSDREDLMQTIKNLRASQPQQPGRPPHSASASYSQTAEFQRQQIRDLETKLAQAQADREALHQRPEQVAHLGEENSLLQQELGQVRIEVGGRRS